MRSIDAQCRLVDLYRASKPTVAATLLIQECLEILSESGTPGIKLFNQTVSDNECSDEEKLSTKHFLDKVVDTAEGMNPEDAMDMMSYLISSTSNMSPYQVNPVYQLCQVIVFSYVICNIKNSEYPDL